MYTRIVRVLAPTAAAVLLVSGCSTTPQFVAKDDPWRGAEERACLGSGVVRESPYIRTRSSLGGPAPCGAERPFEVAAVADGRVGLQPAALLRCPMIPQVDRWVATSVDPAAQRHLGTTVAELKVAASYSCRPINHQWGGRLSEHGHANALDVAAFVLADGRTVTVKAGWNGNEGERAFLRSIHQGACSEFTTVLGPNADSYHRDHFHLDLARHGRDGLMRICK
jgi:hypothetical protein